MLQFAFRTRIKIFFRPDNLIGNAGMAGEKLKWELSRAGASQVPVIKVFNPTPYYVSFGRMEVAVSGRRIDLKPGMVAPFGYESFPWPASAPSQPTKASIEYEVIDDFGGRGLLKKSLL